jgi:hypothetical protein
MHSSTVRVVVWKTKYSDIKVVLFAEINMLKIINLHE